MRIRVLEGHLTAVDKRNIKILLNEKLRTGKLNRKSYLLTPIKGEGEVYKVAEWEKRVKTVGAKPVIDVNYSKIKIEGRVKI